MGSMKADMPSPSDMESMFEDAAYWNRYNQYTPFGNVVWNDDRTSMTQEIPEWMWPMMSQQMGLQSAALSELLGWFGGSPYEFGYNPFSAGGGGGGTAGGGGPFNQEPDFASLAKQLGVSPEMVKSLWSGPSEGWSPEEWNTMRGIWGANQWGPTWDETGNWSETGLTPSWFSGSRQGDDPAAYAAWYAMENLGVDPSIFFGEDWQEQYETHGPSGRPQMWTSDMFVDDWESRLNEELGIPFDWRSDGGVPPSWPPDWFSEGSRETGGPFGAYGGREPEMFWSEDIPNLEWLINWDEVPDLPTLDQFTEDRESITRAMYEQGMGLLTPYMEEQEARRRQSLADRGIPISAEIGSAEMGDWGRTQGKMLGDLSFASLMGGYDEAARQFGLGLGAYQTGLQGELARLGASNQARGQAWNERMGVRGQKFNELASILGLMPTQTTTTGQQPYNFNPNIDVMGGYGIGAGMNQFNTGLFNQWMNNIFNAMSFL